MRYRYVARDDKGVSIQGVVEASTVSEVVGNLREQKLIPVKVTALNSSFDLTALTASFGKVSEAELSTFTRQLATMITAGLPLTDSLNLLKVQSTSIFGRVIGTVLSDVQSGTALSTAMARHPTVFPKVYVALIKAGETAGVVETVLTRLADNMERSREFSSKVKGAMIYPVIVTVGMLGVMLLMMVVVIPKLSDVFKQFGRQLPVSTRIVIATSDFMVSYWWMLLIAAAGGVFLLNRYVHTPIGRRQWDEIMFKIPVFGPLVREVMLTELTRTLALLVGAGIAIVEALTIVSETLGNIIMEKDLKRIARQVEKGFPTSIGFSESELFPPLIGQMIAVGEETGKMDEVLTKISSYFGSESETKVKGLTTAIEPLIMIVLGVGVGFLIFTIILPIYDITNSNIN